MLNRMSSSSKKREDVNIINPKNAGETFTFSPAPGNLDPSTHSDQPPSFDLRTCPSMASVISLRHYLSLSRDLPNEIIDIILDLAEYWPHSSSILDMTTRVYSGHMCYGSYSARPRQKLGRFLSTPESRREWKEDGFLIRTPPLGWRCVGDADASKRSESKSTSTYQPRAKSKPLIPMPRPPTWLPPRGLHPARRVVFEILSREERPENTHRQGHTFCYANSKTSFDASVDTISFPKRTKTSVSRSIDPLLWTAEAATKDCQNQQPSNVCYTIRSKRFTKPLSSKIDDENASSGVTKNYTAHNRKVVRTWRYDGAERCYLPTTDRDFGSEDATEFVKALKEGDCISLWARARKSEEHGRRRQEEGGSRAWCNVVDRVAVHVFWAV
ncbi:MAG: hypothetical protein ALECFALPRED_001715 [Alectoria fallacina]|uniref:Uncharacterized protein n=1 Tax=Alectoria fallacina TaxID=1903189 RepID=A0A8H3JBD1_9LECA|nr:MAG: hypothetical protein ALECFALPRED_001715 [Alectoria fallacina]